MDINLDNLIKALAQFLKSDNVLRDFDNKNFKLSNNSLKDLKDLKASIIEKENTLSNDRYKLQAEQKQHQEQVRECNTLKMDLENKVKILEERESIIKSKENDLNLREENALRGFIKEQEEAFDRLKIYIYH